MRPRLEDRDRRVGKSTNWDAKDIFSEAGYICVLYLLEGVYSGEPVSCGQGAAKAAGAELK